MMTELDFNPYETWRSRIMQLINNGLGDEAVDLMRYPPPDQAAAETDYEFNKRVEFYETRVQHITNKLDTGLVGGSAICSTDK